MADELDKVMERNLRALLETRRRIEAKAPRSVRVADRVTAFTGSMGSVLLHGLLFGGWLLLNSGAVPGAEPWDPFPFVMLAMWASVEAIFLTTFVLISQNRMQQISDQRAELDLQISLLAEHEITRVLTLVDGIAQRIAPEHRDHNDLEALKQDVAPEKVLERIDEGPPDDLNG